MTTNLMSECPDNLQARSLKRSAFVTGLAIILFAAASTTAFAYTKLDQPAKPFPAQANPYGLSAGELGMIYWQWMFSFPDAGHPAYEQGDVVSGAEHQPKHLFILESGNPGIWDRSVTIPAGKGILFTLGDTCKENLSAPGATEQDLLDLIAADYIGLEVLVSGELDGRSIPMQDHFAISPLFDLTIVGPGLFGLPSGTGLAMAAGWFVAMHPLSAGIHTMHLRVEAPDISYLSDTTFHITVK
jgi:hypothetical protein